MEKIERKKNHTKNINRKETKTKRKQAILKEIMLNIKAKLEPIL